MGQGKTIKTRKCDLDHIYSLVLICIYNIYLPFNPASRSPASDTSLHPIAHCLSPPFYLNVLDVTTG